MELIRKLGTRKNKSGRVDSWGEFLCPFCLQLVERVLSNGKKCKSCGCQHHPKPTEELRQRISNTLKGKKHTEEHNKRVSKALKGKKKKALTEEHKQKIRIKLTGIKISEKTKSKISNALRGRLLTEEHKQNLAEAKKGENNPMYGKDFTDEHRQKLKDNHRDINKENNPMYGKKGINHPNWNDGSSFEPYSPEFNKELKQFILERDNYICQCLDCEHKSITLHIHHIDYDKKNSNPENLVTLCNRCHAKTIGKNKRHYYIKYYQNIMMNKLMECLL